MAAPAGRGGATFASLNVPNYRRYLVGQVVSLCGTWMQVIALGWLVLRLGASGAVLGLVTAAQFLPMLLLGAYGGLLADRFDKRRVLVATQSMSAALALSLAVLDLTGAVRLWMVVLIAAALGTVTALDMPTRQAFVHEMVGSDLIANAVTLNTVIMNSARVVGPALAGLVVATAGTGICFLVNAGSFAAVIISVVRMDAARLHRREPVARQPGQIRAGVAYAARTPGIRVPLLMMAVVGTLTYEFQVTLPLLARETFGGTAATYGVMTAAMGTGAVLGGLPAARRKTVSPVVVVAASGAFGLATLLTAVAPTLPVAIASLGLVGAASVLFMSSANAAVQLAADEAMRGRVMALWTVAFLGSTPLGAPAVGFAAQLFGARYGLVVGGIAALLAALYGLGALRGWRTAQAAAVQGAGPRGADPAPEPAVPAQARSSGGGGVYAPAR